MLHADGPRHRREKAHTFSLKLVSKRFKLAEVSVHFHANSGSEPAFGDETKLKPLPVSARDERSALLLA